MQHNVTGIENRIEAKFLYEEIKKKNLVEFIGRDAGTRVEKTGDKWRCICPLHKDSNPSFFIYYNSDYGRGLWSFHCFGCGANGSIIDFCMQFHGFNSPSEAMDYLLKFFGIEHDYEIAEQAIVDAHIGVNVKKKTDSEHYLAARTCYKLVRKYMNNADIKEWVHKAYFTMNKMLVNDDYKGIESIYDKASKLYAKPELVKDDVCNV